MKSYLYHPDFLYYIGEEEAFESPLEPGVFLHASNATEIAPPEDADKSKLYFINNVWEVKNEVSLPYFGEGATQVSMAGDYIPYAIDINKQKEELKNSGFSEEQITDILGF